MICVLSLFGKMDLQSMLKKSFQSNDIYYIEDNCTTSVQLTTQLEARRKEVDAVIIYSHSINMETIKEYTEELRSISEHLRIVLMLVGEPSSFPRSQINEYWEMKLDVIYDNDGFDVEDLVKILKKGKLSNKDFKMKKSESGFIGDIEENTHFTKKVKPVKNEVLSEKAFSKYPEHFTIGVFNAARGAGATWAVINIARYLAMHGYKTSILDMSSTKAVSTLKIKNIDIYSSETNIDELKKQYNVTVIDFGTPIEISPNGENFKLMNHYKPETIQCFTGCNIKLIMGFSDSWNIQKINFFFINDTWRSQFDNSYMFIITGDPQKIKPLFPNGNFFSKEDDYREYILEAMRREEL